MTRPSTELMRSIVETAARAPSSHNTQPWTLCIGANRIELVADGTRALPVTDPYDREFTISCGAALFNLELAAKATALSFPRSSGWRLEFAQGSAHSALLDRLGEADEWGDLAKWPPTAGNEMTWRYGSATRVGGG